MHAAWSLPALEPHAATCPSFARLPHSSCVPHLQAWVLEGDTLSRLSACTLLEDLDVSISEPGSPPYVDMEDHRLLDGLPDLTASCTKLGRLRLSAGSSAVRERSLQDVIRELAGLPCLQEVGLARGVLAGGGLGHQLPLL